jgi:hypothetical protein
MKTNTLSFSLVVLALLPGMARAQGTYLSTPDGTFSNALVVVNGGNVGIGTPNPLGRLTVRNDVGNALIYIDGAEGTDSGILLYRAGIEKWAIYDPRDTDDLYFHTYVGSKPVLTMQSSGNVGIGTTHPTHSLHVNGAARFDSKLIGGGGDAGYFDIYNTWPNDSGATRIGGGGDVLKTRGAFIAMQGNQIGGQLSLYCGDGGKIALMNGNVGIGTQSPQAALDVNGKINCTVLERGLTQTTPQPATSVRWRRIGGPPIPNSARTTSTLPPATLQALLSPPSKP